MEGRNDIRFAHGGKLLARFSPATTARLPAEEAVHLGNYPPALAERWAEIRRRGPPQLGLVNRLPQNAIWMAVRDPHAEIARLLIIPRTGLRDHHLDHASVFFYGDEFIVLDSQGRRTLMGLPDGGVRVVSTSEEKVLAGDSSFHRSLPFRRRAKRLLRAAVIGSTVVPDVGLITLVKYDPTSGI